MLPPSYAQRTPAGGSLQRGYIIYGNRALTRGRGLRREDGMPPPLCVTNACGWNLAARLRIPQTAR